MKTPTAKACQTEVISYMMNRVLDARPAERETRFAAVKSALNLWLADGVCDMRTQLARNAIQAGFGGRLKAHMALLSGHSTRSAEWLALFRGLKEAFEQEARQDIDAA